ncbi:MAG TPA: hypothetical protein VFC78_16140 [Tepidisphaeraceae bacterium]|nr:hypothetical protein [Tepidisphaeraceae bacterium]
MIAVSVDVGYVALFIVLVVVPLVAILAAVVDRMIVHRRQDPVRRSKPTGGFPMIAGPPMAGKTASPPGSTYRIAGAIAATGEPILLRISADTPTQARAQAQLKGVIVTEVVKE